MRCLLDDAFHFVFAGTVVTAGRAAVVTAGRARRASPPDDRPSSRPSSRPPPATFPVPVPVPVPLPSPSPSPSRTTTPSSGGNTLYGFKIPFGSISRLMPRMSATASGGFECRSSPGFIAPTPCSAETLPRLAAVHSYTNGSNTRSNAASYPVGDDTFRCKLPSPRCPCFTRASRDRRFRNRKACRANEPRFGLVHEIVHLLRRKTQIVLVRRPRAFQRERDAFAEIPQPRRLLRVAPDRSGDGDFFSTRANDEIAKPRALTRAVALKRGGLDEDVKRRGGSWEWISRALECRDDEFEARAVHELERVEDVAQTRSRVAEHGDTRGEIGRGDERDVDARGEARREERHLGHHAEGSFRAYEELLEVVAGVILARDA